jgi:hypothetical protein
MSATVAPTPVEATDYWTPMIAIALGQAADVLQRCRVASRDGRHGAAALYSLAGSRRHLFTLVLAARRVLARPHVLTRIPRMHRLRARSAVSPSMFCRRFFQRAADGQ